MDKKEIFRKTLPFIGAKILIGTVDLIACVLLLAVCLGIGWLFGTIGMLVLFIIWLFAVKGINLLLMHYIGYLIKAGHIAVVVEAITKGGIPEEQLDYGKKRVLEKFKVASVYFAVDKLVDVAFNQIQRGIAKVGDAFSAIPGAGVVASLIQFYIQISLGYIDECCIGWTFYSDDGNPYKNAADGVAIYADNWKPLLKNAAKVMGKVLILSLCVLLAAFLVIGSLFKLMHWNPLIAFIFSCLVTWVIKSALLDSYIMIEVVSSYMELALPTQAPPELYDTLCHISDSFSKLIRHGMGEPTIG